MAYTSFSLTSANAIVTRFPAFRSFIYYSKFPNGFCGISKTKQQKNLHYIAIPGRPRGVGIRDLVKARIQGEGRYSKQVQVACLGKARLEKGSLIVDFNGRRRSGRQVAPAQYLLLLELEQWEFPSVLRWKTSTGVELFFGVEKRNQVYKVDFHTQIYNSVACNTFLQVFNKIRICLICHYYMPEKVFNSPGITGVVTYIYGSSNQSTRAIIQINTNQ